MKFIKDSQTRFSLMWALKESFVKNTGDGITINLQNLEFLVDGDLDSLDEESFYMNQKLKISCFFNKVLQNHSFKIWRFDNHFLTVCLSIHDSSFNHVRVLEWTDLYTKE